MESIIGGRGAADTVGGGGGGGNEDDEEDEASYGDPILSSSVDWKGVKDDKVVRPRLDMAFADAEADTEIGTIVRWT